MQLINYNVKFTCRYKYYGSGTYAVNNVLTFLKEIEDSVKLGSIHFARTRDFTVYFGMILRTVYAIKQDCKNEVPMSPRENVHQHCPVTDLDNFVTVS